MQKQNKIQAMNAELIKKRRRNLRSSFRSFTNAPNRMEEVRIKNDVIFINDSKAENVNATYFALQSIRKPVIWIAGGDDAGTDYWELMSLVRQKVDGIILIGEENSRIIEFFAPVIKEIYEAGNMESAVALAYRLSEPGTTVLLSPACKPDMKFADYEDRGEQFKNAVLKRI